MTAADLLILALVAAGIVLALRAIRRGKTGGCSGHCEGCSHSCRR